MGYINSWLFLEKIWSPLDSFFQNGPPFGFCNNFLIIVKINSFNVKKGKINSFFKKKIPIVFFFFFFFQISVIKQVTVFLSHLNIIFLCLVLQ